MKKNRQLREQWLDRAKVRQDARFVSVPGGVEMCEIEYIPRWLRITIEALDSPGLTRLGPITLRHLLLSVHACEETKTSLVTVSMLAETNRGVLSLLERHMPRARPHCIPGGTRED